MFHMQTIHFRKTDDFHLILLVCTVSFWILFQENTTHREKSNLLLCTRTFIYNKNWGGDPLKCHFSKTRNPLSLF